MERDLEQIGLNEKEAKVYVAALELGKASAAEIAKKSGLKRPTTYFTLEQLMKKGLASSTHEGKKQFFMAESPERLEDVFQAKKDEIARQEKNLKKIIPSLKKRAQKGGDGPIVKYYKGKEGALSMVKNLMEFKDDETVWMAYPLDEIKTIFTSEELSQIRFSRVNNKITAKVFYTADNESQQDESDVAVRRKLDGDKYKISADIAIYGDTVRIATFGGEVTGIVIEDKRVADTLKTIFSLAWKSVT